MKNQGCCREKPHPVNLPLTVKQGVEGHQERRQEVATDRQEGHPGGEGREKGSRKAVLSGGGSVVGLYPQACKSCACPASRAKKEPGVSNRDISGLMNGRPYMSEAKSWRDTPLCAVDSRQSLEIFATGDTGRLPVETGIRVLAHRAEEWTSWTHKHSSE